MFKLILEKAEEPEINTHWIIEKAREWQQNIYFCFIDSAKAFDCVDHKKLWKIQKEMGIPHHLTCFFFFFFNSFPLPQSVTMPVRKENRLQLRAN